MHTNIDRITMLATLITMAVGVLLFLAGGAMQHLSITVAGMLTGVVGMTIPSVVACGKAIYQWQRRMDYERP